MLYRNSFALACYFVSKKEATTGYKILTSLFDALGWEKRITYFNGIQDSLEYFHHEYAQEINANQEINKLFNH